LIPSFIKWYSIAHLQFHSNWGWNRDLRVKLGPKSRVTLYVSLYYYWGFWSYFDRVLDSWDLAVKILILWSVGGAPVLQELPFKWFYHCWEVFIFWNLELVGKGRVYVYSQLMVLKIKEPVLTLDRAVQKKSKNWFWFWTLKTGVQRTYPKLPLLLPVLWKFSRALLLLKIINNPNQRFSDFENFKNSYTSGSLIFEIKKKKPQELMVLNKI
jgi:hypothetical protein